MLFTGILLYVSLCIMICKLKHHKFIFMSASKPNATKRALDQESEDLDSRLTRLLKNNKTNTERQTGATGKDSGASGISGEGKEKENDS